MIEKLKELGFTVVEKRDLYNESRKAAEEGDYRKAITSLVGAIRGIEKTKPEPEEVEKEEAEDRKRPANSEIGIEALRL